MKVLNSWFSKVLKSVCSSPDKYEVMKKIGRGKYSDVYEGIDNVNQKSIIIKILKPGLQLLVLYMNISEERENSKRN